MSHLAAESFAPPQSYLRQIDNLRHRASAPVRYASARRLMEQVRRARGEPARRIRLLWDLAQLIKGAAPGAEAEQSVELARPVVDELQRQVTELAANPPADAPADLIVDLQALVSEVSRDTWSSFQAFLESPVGKEQFNLTHSLEDLAKFEEWMALALPALGLDLPDEPQAQEMELNRRIEELLSRVAPSDRPEHDRFGLRERFGRDMALYVHRHLQREEPEPV